MDEEGKVAEDDNEDPDAQKILMELPNENRIGTFDEINWRDPFPAPKRKIQQSRRAGVRLQEVKVDEMVYSETRFNPMRPPNLTFIPSKLIMKKLMRVCTEIKDPIELYYIF